MTQYSIMDVTQYQASPTRRTNDTTIGSFTGGSSPRKSPMRKNVGSKDKKEIKFNYYDPQAYDDPHQFYQLHKEKVLSDLCGNRLSPRRNQA